MKRLVQGISLLLALLLTLSGCGETGSDTPESTDPSGANAQSAAAEPSGAAAEPSGDAGDKIVLNWWVWATVDIANQMSKAVFDVRPELADTYHIEPQLQPGPGEIAQKVRMMLAANETMPEILMYQCEYIPEFAESGALTDMTEHIEPYKDQMTGGAINLVSYNGRQWGLPYQIKPRVWVYRSDLFAEAGIDPNAIKTTDDFIAAGLKLREMYPDSHIWQFNSAQFSNSLMLHILSGNGGRFFDESGNYILDQDLAVRAAWEDVKKIFDAGIVYDVVADTPDHQQGYANGAIASDLTGTWIKNNLPQWAPELEGVWDEAQWPAIGGGTGGGEGGSMWVFPANATNRDGAIEFMKELVLTKEGNLNAYRERSIYPSMIEAVEDPLLKEPHRYMGSTLYEAEAEATENFKSFTYSPNYASEMEIVIQHFSQYLQGAVSLDEALAAANNDLVSQIGNAFDK